MALIIPSEAIARRWNGALLARLRRAPLEEFLRAHAVTPASAGTTQDSDNVSHATILMVNAGLTLYFQDREDALLATQHAVVGQAACLISRALAALILEPGCWRTAALVSTYQLLRPWIGVNAAAYASAAAAHAFTFSLVSCASAADARLSERVSIAVSRKDPTAVTDAAVLISQRLACAYPQQPPYAGEMSLQSLA